MRLNSRRAPPAASCSQAACVRGCPSPPAVASARRHLNFRCCCAGLAGFSSIMDGACTRRFGAVDRCYLYVHSYFILLASVAYSRIASGCVLLCAPTLLINVVTFQSYCWLVGWGSCYAVPPPPLQWGCLDAAVAVSIHPTMQSWVHSWRCTLDLPQSD